MLFGSYVQILAAFLLLSLGHYFAAAFLPIADCDETYNFVEPIHYLLYGSGMQTWENCPQYGLRSYLFAWVYAWPTVFIRGASGLSSVDAYYYLRIFNGRMACLCELFFLYSVWAAFSGKTAVVALVLLLTNYPIAHAAVSVLPTSFVMCVYFVALGCWLRTRGHTARSLRTLGKKSLAAAETQPQPRLRRSCYFFVWATVILVVFACVVGWPFASLVTVPCGLDLLIRFPFFSIVCLLSSLVIVGGAAFAVDSHYYCTPTLSAWRVVVYNVFGGEARGPDLYGTEPWYFFFKNLLLNFHAVFLAAMFAPLLILAKRSRGGGARSSAAGLSRGRVLLYVSPFFLWLGFWTVVAHKEERFFAPAYPFLLLAAIVVVAQLFFPDGESTAPATCAVPAPGCAAAAGSTAIASRGGGRRAAPSSRRGVESNSTTTAGRSAKNSVRRTLLHTAGSLFLLLSGLVSFSRAMAVYHFYSGPERLFYDWYPLLQASAELKMVSELSTARVEGEAQNRSDLFNLCVGKEWYRFPSSFFIDKRHMRYSFIKTRAFSGMLSVPFRTPAGAASSGGLLRKAPQRVVEEVAAHRERYGMCACGADGVNDLNRETSEQYVANVEEECDVIFDSLSPHGSISAEEAARERDELHLDAFPHPQLVPAARTAAALVQGQRVRPVDAQYAVLDVDRTPLWCRVLYYPFGISSRCARWRPLVLQGKYKPFTGTDE